MYAKYIQHSRSRGRGGGGCGDYDYDDDGDDVKNSKSIYHLSDTLNRFESMNELRDNYFQNINRD